MAAAPAPLTTTRILSSSLPAIFAPFRSAAEEMIAVPCWSSCIRGMSSSSRQAGLDLETLRGLDVFEVDASEGGSDGFHRADELLGIGRVDLDVEGVDACIGLEEHAFALHDGLGRQGAMLPSPRTAVPFEITATRLPLPVYL